MFHIRKSILIEVTKSQMEELLLEAIQKQLGEEVLFDPTISWDENQCTVTGYENPKNTKPEPKPELVETNTPFVTEVAAQPTIEEKVSDVKEKLQLPNALPAFGSASFKTK